MKTFNNTKENIFITEKPPVVKELIEQSETSIPSALRNLAENASTCNSPSELAMYAIRFPQEFKLLYQAGYTLGNNLGANSSRLSIQFIRNVAQASQDVPLEANKIAPFLRDVQDSTYNLPRLNPTALEDTQKKMLDSENMKRYIDIKNSLEAEEKSIKAGEERVLKKQWSLITKVTLGAGVCAAGVAVGYLCLHGNNSVTGNSLPTPPGTDIGSGISFKGPTFTGPSINVSTNALNTMSEGLKKVIVDFYKDK